MDFYDKSDFAFPGAPTSVFFLSHKEHHANFCGNLKTSNNFEKQRVALAACKLDLSTSTSLEESQVLGKGVHKGSILDFRSRKETACDTEIGLSKKSDSVEVVDLTNESEAESLESTQSNGLLPKRSQTIKTLFTQEPKDNELSQRPRLSSITSDGQQSQRKRKKSLLDEFKNREPKRKESKQPVFLEDELEVIEEDLYLESSQDPLNLDQQEVSKRAAFSFTPTLGKRSHSSGRSISEPELLAELHGGKMLKIKRTKEGTKISFTCRMNHRFSLFQGEEGNWCKVCKTLMSNARMHAAVKGGRLISEKLSEELEFECAKGHRWSVSYRKCMKSWCKVCKKEKKKLLKQILEDENKKLEEKRKTRQDQMLEEARIDMINLRIQEKKSKSKDIETFRMLEEHVSKVAARYAREFIAKSAESSFEQMIELYRVLIYPEKSLNLYFQALTEKDLKKEFRKYTILLHPDKNCHPKAKDAFQKIFGAFQNAMTKNKENL